MPCHAMPCHAMPCHAMPCHAMPCHAMPCHAMPCHAMPCHAMPCHAMPYHTIPYHTKMVDANMIEARTANEIMRIIRLLQVTNRVLVKSSVPIIAWIPNLRRSGGRIYMSNLLLNWYKDGNDFTSSLSFSHSEIQEGKKLLLYRKILEADGLNSLELRIQ